jgi:hypothetical protein
METLSAYFRPEKDIPGVTGKVLNAAGSVIPRITVEFSDVAEILAVPDLLTFTRIH